MSNDIAKDAMGHARDQFILNRVQQFITEETYRKLTTKKASCNLASPLAYPFSF